MGSLLPLDIESRRTIASASLRPLANALRAELQPLLAGALVIPEGKARLTRLGGRCEFDGTLLEFDPYSPHEHRCRQCQRVFTGPAHHDWWAMGAQLWTAERAVQAAALYWVRDDKAAGALSVRILRELGQRYHSWPNQDNALGPTRPFFSTYLESIWLLNLCHAVSLLESAGIDAETARELSAVRGQLIEPSRDLIASYHEGRSNRQVWNEVAILSASCVLGDHRTIEKRLDSRTGLHNLIATGLLDDGSWYEGENYHLFAHRGLWYGVQLLRALGRPLDASLDARYRAGFVTPFLGLLPDDTLPSRRDSQYAVSIRQWRFAEWCELGIAHATALGGRDASTGMRADRRHDEQTGARALARTDVRLGARPDARLTGTLQRLYEADPNGPLQSHARHPYSTADAERNEPAGLLSRADLSWRSLLMADAELQPSRSWSPGSVCLPSQGLAVIRREHGQMYVALEGGHTGGGHGHPDRLALTLQHGRNRWLEDPGTGSYVERKLHWYRSTLAHAAPVIDGASQDGVAAQLLAFEDRGWAGWIKKRVENIKPGVNVQRTVVVCEAYVIDLLEWDAAGEVQVDLPVARRVDQCSAQHWERANPGGAGGLEDGFDFLVDAEVDRHFKGFAAAGVADSHGEFAQSAQAVRHSPQGAGYSVRLSSGEWGSDTQAHYGSSQRFELWRAMAPASPGRPAERLHWIRTRAQRGSILGMWTWNETLNIRIEQAPLVLTITGGDGTSAVHSATDSGWHIDLKAGHATSSIDLKRLPQGAASVGQLRPAVGTSPGDHDTEAEQPPSDVSAHVPVPVHSHPAWVVPEAPAALSFELGEAHYLRTEQSWADAGKPRATINLRVDDNHLVLEVTARTGAPTIPALDADNALDNERRDVNADGVQLYLGPKSGPPWTRSWLAVPAKECAPRARVTPLLANTPDIVSTWNLTADGWWMSLSVPLASVPVQADGTFALELIVNERPAHRVRRRGQLVLSGGAGFAYLRGDRSDSTQAMTFRMPPR